MKPDEPTDPLEELVSKLRQQLRALDTESNEDSFLHSLIDVPGLILTTETMLKDAEKRLAGSRQHSPRSSNVPFLVPFNAGSPADLVEKHRHPQPSPVFSRQVTAYIALGVFGLGLGGYALHEGRLTHKLTAENQQVAAPLNAAPNQIDHLTATVPQRPSQPELRSIAAAAPGHGTQGIQRESLRSRFGGQDSATADMPDEVVVRHFDRTGQRIEKPVGLASSSAPPLEPVATMDTQLVSSQKRGEQNHYEFDIDKSRAFQPGGPLGIRLRKANVKHQYADLELLIGGRSLSQNHVNLYQPVVFYTPSTAQPVELVISSIDSGRIRGYVSIPKSRRPELVSMSNANTETGASTK